MSANKAISKYKNISDVNLPHESVLSPKQNLSRRNVKNRMKFIDKISMQNDSQKAVGNVVQVAVNDDLGARHINHSKSYNTSMPISYFSRSKRSLYNSRIPVESTKKSEKNQMDQDLVKKYSKHKFRYHHSTSISQLFKPYMTRLQENNDLPNDETNINIDFDKAKFNKIEGKKCSLPQLHNKTD